MLNNNFSTLPGLERNIYPSKEASTFDIYAPRWVLSFKEPRGVIIPPLKELPIEQREALLRTIAERATKNAAISIKCDLHALKSISKQFGKSDDFYDSGIDVENLLILLSSKATEEYKSIICRLIIGANELGYEEVFEDGVLYLAQQYSPKKRIRLHPDRFEASRSFTEAERKQLYYQLAREFHLGNIPLNLRLVATLSLVTGKRPTQIGSTKFIDFSLEEITLGQNVKRSIIIYNAPVAKQQGQTFRSKFNQMPITSSFNIWQQLEELRAENSKKISQALNVELTDEQTLLLPLIMPGRETSIDARYQEANNNDLDLSTFLKSDRLHNSDAIISGLIIKLNDHLSIISEYTGRPLKINAKRFRHTRATNLALSGATILEIADALDHSDIRSASEYVDNLPVRAVKIGSQIEETLGVLAKVFRGAPTSDTGKVIKLYTKNGVHNVGGCGMESFCKENYPIACYECELFNPNPFGNHAAVQEYVEDKIREAKEFGDSRQIENWHTILLAVLERRYVADQHRLKILNEAPQILKLEDKDNTNE